jgi:hypothetical protein
VILARQVPKSQNATESISLNPEHFWAQKAQKHPQVDHLMFNLEKYNNETLSLVTNHHFVDFGSLYTRIN